MPFNYPMSKVSLSPLREFTVSFEEALAVINEFPVAHEVLGLCYVLQGRLGDALNEYKKVLELNPALSEKVYR